MFKFRQIRPEGSDCTAPYEIILDKEYTVREFIETVLTELPREWGYFGIKKDGTAYGDPYCEYRGGQLLSRLPEELLDQEINYVTAFGGWSRMDYQFRLKEEVLHTDEQEEN